MRFSSTVDALSQENRLLRGVVLLLGFGIILLSVAVLLLNDKSPRLVLRTSHGMEIVSTTSLERSRPDVEQAVRLMLRARLDTETTASEAFLSQKQLELRSAEQRELKSRGFFQAVIVRTVDIHDGSAVVAFDRVISVGEVRSAVATQANIAFEEIQPNELNPYGLRLASLIPTDPQQSRVGVTNPVSSKPLKQGEGK